MDNVDLSFIEDGLKVIFENLLIIAIVLAAVSIGSIILFKVIRLPKFIANILTTVAIIVAFVVMVLKYYLPGIISAF